MQSNISILPFYDKIAKQSHRKWYAYGQVFPLIAPSRFILPFQLRVLATEDIAIQLRTKAGDLVADITTKLLDSGLTIADRGTYRLITNPGSMPFDTILREGQFYIDIIEQATDTHHYSEVFTFSNDLSTCIKVEYWNETTFAANDTELEYNVPYKNKVYIPTDISKPEYEDEEDVVKRDGYTFVEKQISYKKYRFFFFAPEYLCDAMRIIRMHDNVVITDQHGDEYRADTFLTTVKWDEVGYLAQVDAEFTSDTVIKKNGTIRVLASGGSFNDDFNDDFNS